MATIPISGLPAASSALLTDIFPAVQSGTTYKETLLQVQTLFNITSTSTLQLGKLGLGSSVASSAILSLSSTSLGFLPPVMTTTQKNAISSPAAGLTVYDSTLGQLQYYNGAAWVGASGTAIAPTVQTFLAAGSGTYTTPAGVLYIVVECIGPGGGGSGNGNSGSDGSAATTFGTTFLSAGPGTGANSTSSGQGGLGGTASGGDINITGGGGAGQYNISNASGGTGGSAAYGGAGCGAAQATVAATIGVYGGGGGGGHSSTTGYGGGGSGGYCKKLITSPNSTYAYVVGQGGAAGSGATLASAAGGDGAIFVYEYYVPTGTTGIATITGTANQVLVNGTSGSAQIGAALLTLPQSIATTSNVQFGTLGLGSSIATSAILSLSSTTLGFLPPVMTTTQKNAIASTATGLVVYDSSLSQLQFYNGASWVAASGNVTSVAGTSNEILVNSTTSAQTGAVTVSIASTYVGQTSITTLGTIGTGTWQGTVVGLAYGGTNADLTASNGGIFYSTGSAGAILSGTATANQVLLSGSSSAPAWSTATYPASVPINELLYSSGVNIIGGITASDNGVLISSNTGVPSWLANGTAGYVLTANSSAPPSWQAVPTSVLTWTAASSSPITAAVNTGYYITDASQVTITLPATAAVASVVAIVGNGAGGWILQPGSGQTIKVINVSASTSITSAEQYDCIEVFCTVANTTWVARSFTTTAFTYS